MEFICPDCSAKMAIDAEFTAESIVCTDCHRMYELTATKGYVIREKLQHAMQPNQLKPGDSGILKGERVVVCGVIIKRVYDTYNWREYLIRTEKGAFRYLSESEGHWILLDEAPHEQVTFDLNPPPVHIEYENSQLRLYENTRAEIIGAAGFFDYELPRGSVRMIEYIRPPLLYSIEKHANYQTIFIGEHLPKRELKKAFPDASLPYQAGIGIVQPFYLDLRNLVIIFLLVIGAMVFTNWSIFKSQHQSVVLNESLSFSKYDGKEFVSPPFELNGGAAPLSINVASEVDNSWASLEITLVNEVTNEEISASKDIEYYHGYTEGENWTEGSQSQDFNICGVKEGKYHLVIVPLKAPEDQANGGIRVRAVWNEPSNRNLIIVSVILIVLIVLGFFHEHSMNRKRWADSDYSPYPEQEES